MNLNAGVHDRSVADISDAELVKRAVMNAHYAKSLAVRWAHVAQTFGLGSTYSAQLCQRFGYDPNDVVGNASMNGEEDS